MRFERAFIVPLPPAAVWDLLWDIERMVACVPGCTGAEAIEDKKRYRASIVEKVGPFKLDIPLDIEIGEIVPQRSLRMRATGKDPRIGTEVTWDLALDLEPDAGQTHCRLCVDAEVVGRLVSLGQGIIKLKGNQTMTRFAHALLVSLDSTASRQVER